MTMLNFQNMKRYSLGLLLFTFCNLISAQQMTNKSLQKIITQTTDSITGTAGNWQFQYKGQQLFCLTDEKNNRMRIMAPITPSAALDKGLLLDALTANFHSALDVRYAIANGIVWSAFIHPLRELSMHEVESAISQVHLASKTFGTTFSSTELIFGSGGSEPASVQETATPLQKL